MSKVNFSLKSFLVITFLVSIWVNISEVFRYFLFVRPEMHESLYMVPNVADIDLPIFMIWGVWDTLLSALITFMFWLCMQVFGNNTKTIIVSGMMSWCFFFVLFWVGMANMGLSKWSFVLLPLSLALLEMIVATFIASKLYMKTAQIDFH